MMKVTFLKPSTLGGKLHKVGTSQVHDRDVRSVEFKKLVKSGAAHLAPRSEAEQKLQAHHDTFQAGLAHQDALKNHTRDERMAAAAFQKKDAPKEAPKAMAAEWTSDAEREAW